MPTDTPSVPKDSDSFDPLTSKLTDEIITTELFNLVMADLGQKEDHGSNRSTMIDAINRRLGVPMGSPYCIGGLVVRGIEPLCKKFGLKNPVPMVAGTQDFWALSKHKGYAFDKPSLAKAGDVGIMQQYADPGRGHAYLFVKNEAKSTFQQTLEYNTDKDGARDGDGVYLKFSRSQMGDSAKKYLGHVDVIAWIMFANPERF